MEKNLHEYLDYRKRRNLNLKTIEDNKSNIIAVVKVMGVVLVILLALSACGKVELSCAPDGNVIPIWRNTIMCTRQSRRSAD